MVKLEMEHNHIIYDIIKIKSMMIKKFNSATPPVPKESRNAFQKSTYWAAPLTAAGYWV